MRNRRLNHSQGYKNNFFYRLILNQRFLALLNLIIIILILFPIAKIYSQKKVIEKELQELEANIKQYTHEGKDLQQLLQHVDTEGFLKAQARLNLNLKEPGERVIVIEREEGNIISKRDDLIEEIEPSGLEKWINYFFK